MHRAKPPQVFVCHLLHKERGYLVLQYTASDAYTIGGITLDKGTITIAHYWGERNYVLWKFKKPDGAHLGYLFHIATDVEIGEDCVRYEDLELDIWFSPDGNPNLLDEDEVRAYYHKGVFDDRTFSLIEAQKVHILNNARTIIENAWPDEELS